MWCIDDWFGAQRIVVEPPFVDIVQDGGALGIAELRPQGDFFDGAQAAPAKLGDRVHLAKRAAGRGSHSDQHEAVQLVADHFNGFERFVAADSGQHGQMQTPVAGR